MDIQEQIKDLTEKFEILLEKGVSVNKWAGAAEKRIKDNPQMGVTSRGKEELERLKLISKLPKNGKSANTVKAEMDSDAIKASNKALFTKDPKEKEKLEKEAWEKSLIATDNKGFCLNKYKAPKKMNDSNSYNEVVSQLLDLKEEFSNLFEVEGMGGSASDVPPSTNKVKKDVKTKNGKVELVSVEDELFPKDGNKREQFRQKVIDTINGMIQGTATLEDLLQVVRQKQVKAVKEGFEGAIELLEDLINEFSEETVGRAFQARFDKYNNDYDKVDTEWEEKRKSIPRGPKRKKFDQEMSDKLEKMQDESGKKLDFYKKWLDFKNKSKSESYEGFEGAVELLEELIKESSHKRKYGNSNAEDGDTVGHLGTKYFKDGSAMHPHRVTKSNGHNGVDYAPHGTEYYDFDDKKVLQSTIKKLKKEGKEGLEGEEFKKVQKELTNPDTKNNMYGAPVRWASWKLANRKGKSDLPHKGIGVYTYRKGKNDGSKTKDDKDVKERASETKKRLMDKSESSESYEGFESAIKLLEDLINEVSDATIEGAVTCANNNVINADRNNNQKDIDRYKKIKKLASLRAEKTGRKLKANVDTGEYKHVNKNESIEEMVDEALEKSAKILELFDRPDLLNDVDSLLGSPVKKLINKTISSLKWKRKDKKVKTNKA